MEDFNLKPVRSEQELQKALAIRKAVFVMEQGIPEELEYDEYDSLNAEAVHLLVWGREKPSSSQKAVATGRLILKAEGPASLSRIAVLRQHRGQGLGRAVVQRLEEHARRLGIAYLNLQPHYYLEEFYRKLGYSKIPGPRSNIAGHPLITMDKNL